MREKIMSDNNYEPVNAARVDIESITDFQKDLYFPDDTDTKFDSYFTPAPSHMTWSTHVPNKFKCSTENEYYIFTPDMKFHYLMYTVLRQKLPYIRVKKQYRDKVQICWTHNLGLNLILYGNLSFNDDVIQGIDRIWLNMFYQHNVKEQDRQHIDMMIGNIPQLQEWNSKLPSYTLNIPQLWWYYCRNEALAVPLFLLSSQSLSQKDKKLQSGRIDTIIRHKYKLMSNISDLIRMRIKEGNVWIEKKCSLKFIEFPKCEKDGYTLEPPELWGRFVYANDGEINWFFDDNNKDNEYQALVDDVISYDQVKPQKYGDVITVDLPCGYPCREIHWVAENISACNNNYYSNFTTKCTDLVSGWNPVKLIRFQYGDFTRLTEMSGDFFTLTEPLFHSIARPREPGYNKYSIAYKGSSYNDIGIVFKEHNTKLTFRVGNNNPFTENDTNSTQFNISEIDGENVDSDEEDNTESNNCLFKIYVRLRVIKTLKIVDGKYQLIPNNVINIKN